MSNINAGPKHTKKKSAITLDRIYVAEFQKSGTITAQIRQVITTISEYPGKQTETDMQQNIFSNSEFGFTGQVYTNTENRVAWLLVPVGTTEEMVNKKLVAANEAGACIYRVLSNQPILDAHQKYAVSVGLNGATLDTFAVPQVLRFPKTHAKEGQISLDANNKVQYRRTFFWTSPKADIDLRSTDPADVYVSPEIKVELAGIGNTTANVASDDMVDELADGQEL